jgi:DNA polymerase V
MEDDGIDDGDLLVMDKSLSYKEGSIAVCFLNDEFTMKYIRILDDGPYLVPANNEFKPISINGEDEQEDYNILD